MKLYSTHTHWHPCS